MRDGTSESTGECEARVEVDALWLLRRDLGKSNSSHGGGSVGVGVVGGGWVSSESDVVVVLLRFVGASRGVMSKIGLEGF